MIQYVDLSFRLVNGLVTLILVHSLYGIYKRTTKPFFLYWSIGFSLIGINIILNTIISSLFETQTTQLLDFTLILGGFILMITGIGELFEKTRLLLISSLVLPLVPLLQNVLGQEWIPTSFVLTVVPSFFIAISLTVIHIKWRLDLKLLVIGWTTIFLLNVALILDLADPGFVYFMSIFGKIVIYWGINQPSFAFIVDDLKTFKVGGVATQISEASFGNFTLINFANSHRDREVQWIKERALNNSKKGVRTILITLYDLITPKDVYDAETEGDLYFVCVLPGTRNTSYIFDEQIMTINDDLIKMDILFSDVIKYSNDHNLPCEILLYSLSHLIHTHGWKRIYTFITSKMPSIKASQVKLTGFYYPKTHENLSDILKFEKLADEVVTH